MSVETALSELWRRVGVLRETLVALRLTAVVDVPGRGRTAFSDRLGDDVEELDASVAEVFNAIGAVLASADQLNAVCDAVAAAHEQVGRARQLCWVMFGERDAQIELDRLRRRGGRWAGWVDAVRTGADAAPDQLADADAAVRAAWRELVEKAAASPIRVEANAVGQQVTFPATERTRAPAG
jgi:hypothetical protein